MKVIVASFPKCGTKTLKRCMKIFGYNVYDYDENFTFLEDEWLDIWNNGASVEKFKKMYENVDVVTDLPACYYWEMIHKAFPDAKIILTTRKSEEDWLKSWDCQMKTLERSFYFLSRTLLTPTGRRFLAWQRIVGRVIMDCPSQKWNQILHQPDPEVKKRKYREHNQSVLQKAPKGQLLEYNLKDGWKPLCNFLQKDIPTVQFPHANKGSLVLGPDGGPNLVDRFNKELSVVIGIIIAILGLFLYFLMVILNWK